MRHIHTLAVVIIILAGGVIGVSAELSTEYSVNITDSMDIPAQTVETEWGEATITEVGKEEAQNFLELSTDAPESESYAIRIVDSEQRNLKSEFVSGGDVENRDFFLDYVPGTYVVALTQDGGDTAVEVEPFIIKGYTVDQSVSDVTEGESITVDIQLTAVSDDPADPQVINVTLFSDEVTRITEATKTGENSYQANFSTDELSTGSYDIYTGVETDNDIYGYTELIGVSDSISVTVESTTTPTPTPAPVSNTSIDIIRSVSSSEVTSGAQVTITTEVSGANGSVSTNSSYTPAANSAIIQSTTVNDVSASPVLSQATVNGSTVTLENIGTDVTVTITEELTVGERLNVTHNITGNVTVGRKTFEVDPVSVSVTANTTTNPFPDGIPGVGSAPPTDTDDDGTFEDITGDGEFTFDDAIALAFASNTQFSPRQQQALDFDGDGDVDFDDAIALAFE